MVGVKSAISPQEGGRAFSYIGVCPVRVCCLDRGVTFGWFLWKGFFILILFNALYFVFFGFPVFKQKGFFVPTKGSLRKMHYQIAAMSIFPVHN